MVSSYGGKEIACKVIINKICNFIKQNKNKKASLHRVFVYVSLVTAAQLMMLETEGGKTCYFLNALNS